MSRFPITEKTKLHVCAKGRTGPPIDGDEDYELDIWAGVAPLKTERKAPVPDANLYHAVSLPNYLK